METLTNNKAVLIGLAVLAFLIALLLVVMIGRMLFGGRLRLPGARARQARLGIVDAFDLDRQRQLIIVRRDNTEHLIMIGGPNDLLIESEIVRVEARDFRREKEGTPSSDARIPAPPRASVGEPTEAPAAPSPEPLLPMPLPETSAQPSDPVAALEPMRPRDPAFPQTLRPAPMPEPTVSDPQAPSPRPPFLRPLPPRPPIRPLKRTTPQPPLMADDTVPSMGAPSLPVTRPELDASPPKRTESPVASPSVLGPPPFGPTSPAPAQTIGPRPAQVGQVASSAQRPADGRPPERPQTHPGAPKVAQPGAVTEPVRSVVPSGPALPKPETSIPKPPSAFAPKAALPGTPAEPVRPSVPVDFPAPRPEAPRAITPSTVAGAEQASPQTTNGEPKDALESLEDEMAKLLGRGPS